MPDFFYLTGPQGTTLNLGSWLRADPGPDFGARDVPKQTYAENPLAEGGVLAFESVGVRRMSFPLLLASGGAGLSLDGLAGVLRKVARPGAYIDLQPVNVPTGEMVRFDVLGGRVQQSGFTAGLQRVSRRNVDVELDVKPYGYWPTQILLASVGPATAFPFTMSVPAGSIIGDAPGLAKLTFQPSTATYYVAANTWEYDGFWYSLERNGGTNALVPTYFSVGTSFRNYSASMVVLSATGAASDGFSPFGVKSVALPVPLNLAGGGSAGGKWFVPWFATNMDANNNAPTWMRGRWHVFAALRTSGSHAIPWTITMDEAFTMDAPIASANPVATLIPHGQSTANGYIDSPTSGAGYCYLDLGEHTWPPGGGSGAADGFYTRIWAFAGPSGVPSSPTTSLELGGLFLQRLGQAAGIVGRGWIVPTPYSITATGAGGIWSLPGIGGARVIIDSISQRMLQTQKGADLATQVRVINDMRAVVSGQFPLIATANNLDIGVFQRYISTGGGTNTAAQVALPVVSASLHYQPRFAFLKGL